jgi:hypothetical protein
LRPDGRLDLRKRDPGINIAAGLTCDEPIRRIRDVKSHGEYRTAECAVVLNREIHRLAVRSRGIKLLQLEVNITTAGPPILPRDDKIVASDQGRRGQRQCWLDGGARR